MSDPVRYIVSVPKHNVDDVVVIRLKDVTRVVGNDIQVLAHRPPEDGRGKKKSKQFAMLGTLKLDHIGGAGGKAEPPENLMLYDIVDAPRIDVLDVGPTAARAPGEAGGPVSQEVDQ
jgi:hypothetical protein